MNEIAIVMAEHVAGGDRIMLGYATSKEEAQDWITAEKAKYKKKSPYYYWIEFVEKLQ